MEPAKSLCHVNRGEVLAPGAARAAQASASTPTGDPSLAALESSSGGARRPTVGAFPSPPFVLAAPARSSSCSVRPPRPSDSPRQGTEERSRRWLLRRRDTMVMSIPRRPPAQVGALCFVHLLLHSRRRCRRRDARGGGLGSIGPRGALSGGCGRPATAAAAVAVAATTAIVVVSSSSSAAAAAAAAAAIVTVEAARPPTAAAVIPYDTAAGASHHATPSHHPPIVPDTNLDPNVPFDNGNFEVRP